MLLNPNWSFDEALREISDVYEPGGYTSGPQRNRLIEAWGQVVGRNRAISELDQAVARYGSLTALARTRRITVRTLRKLRATYSGLPAEPARRRQLAAGQRFGRWHLVSKLGAGGNADVWKVRSTESEGAIKILRRAKGKSLERFRAEVALLGTLAGCRGILPVVDASIPDVPSGDWDVWFVMPLAVPVVELVAGGASSRDVVAGIREVCQTMAALHSRNISHRDLKPENLFKWRNRWVVGDFGIASFPGKAALTADGSKLGPVHFIAPEMLHNPLTADGAAADVYSLAKTLWVLLSGQRYPPPGEQRRANDYVRMERWVHGPGMQSLNSVFEQCTRFAVEHRMTMTGLRDSLAEWLSRH
jgi:eukaryotic-like serine/threonine-protein kinase